MSERWGKCRSCNGSGRKKFLELDPVLFRRISIERDCSMCGGDGWDGSMDAYEDKNDRYDWEKQCADRKDP
jgi:DnaJ-class molecular chaperone